MKWLIVEDALRDRKGHWLEYVSTFVRGLKELGDEVTVLCDRKAEGFILEQTGARPVLPVSIWHRMGDGAGALQRYARVPGHAIATLFAMRKVFRGFNHGGHREHRDRVDTQGEAPSPATSYPLPATSSPPDWIFIPTVLVHHLLGWWMLLKLRSVPKKSRVLLFFPNAPVRLANNGRAHMGPDLTGKLFRFIIRQLGPEVRSGKVVLGAETHAMRSALTEVTGVEFTYLPHPVEAEKLRIQEPRSESIKATVKPLVFGCYGAARWEKGSDVLQAAIRLVLQEKPEIPVNFVFQWLEDFKDEHGLCVSLDPWMREHPKVEVVERYFNEGEIHLRLAQTDVMVLPYRKPYRLRVSRVVIEAMLNGMPVIATEDTTLLEQVNEHGCGLACQEGSAESLARAILQAAANSDLMQRVAKEKAPEVQSNFSVDRFRQLLMNQTTKRQRQ